MNKKLVGIFAAAFCAFGLAACSSGDANPADSNGNPSAGEAKSGGKVLKLLETSNIKSLLQTQYHS